MSGETPDGVVVTDSATKLPASTDGAVVVCGSHGAVYAAYLVAKAGARAAIHNDAGIGRDGAGIGGLAWAQGHGMAMAAIACNSARIGDGSDTLRRGIISRANALAVACGVEPGQGVAQALRLLRSAPWPRPRPAPLAEGRSLHGPVVCLDSFSMADAVDRERVVASGSHGGALAGETAAAIGPSLALFNDAGMGIERAGMAGLPILDRAGIAGAVVAAASARIGDGRSTLLDGRLSEVNETAYRLGARRGGSALEFALAVAEKRA
jgi:hypothetical protein